MKSITAIALFAVAGSLGSASAFAQTHAVRATMPFAFTVGNKLLPAGTYTITPVSDDIVEIQNSVTHTAVLSEAIPESNAVKSGSLVFDKYAGQYFLREIAGGVSALNVDLPLTKSEQKARMQETFAGGGSEVDIGTSAGIVTCP
jgi:hypothetical protein